jgi:hypothetical protein
MLHLTKVAVGCRDMAEVAARQAFWATELGAPGQAFIHTRMMPRRADELVGGSLFWIIAHTLVARQPILGLAMVETPWGVKCQIDLVPGPVLVQPRHCRAHQGWRYLAEEQAPGDAGEGPTLPTAMAGELAALGLL